jgi:hypothetical protein
MNHTFNNNDKIVWEDHYVPKSLIAKGLIILIAMTIITSLLLSILAFGIALVFFLLFLPFVKAYLDNKLYISITLTEDYFYIKRTLIRRGKKFNLKELTSIIISICDITHWEKYAPVKFSIKIVTLFGEKNFTFIQGFSVPKKYDWPLEVTKKMRTEFKPKLFPKFIYIEQKAPIEKRKAYFPSYLKGEI